MSVRTSPSAWVDALNRSDTRASSWPGPRPLTEVDGLDLLVGREGDLQTLLQAITYYRITHLTGLSGVGKTSLLLAGMVPELRNRGYTVVMCREWFEAAGDIDFDIFLAEQLFDSLQDRTGFTRDSDLFWQLDAMEGQGVVILDQFEELVRHTRSKQQEVFAFLQDVYHSTRIPVVLSYRSEYLHVFRPLDRDLELVERTLRHEVRPVGDAAARQLIRKPRPPVDADTQWDWQEVIEEGAAESIERDWVAARRNEEWNNIPIGLLHLQGLLFSLAGATSGRITAADYESYRGRANHAKGSDTAESLMAFALEESAETRLAAATVVGEEVGMDAFLRNGITTLLTRIVPHLSSGGFKLERDLVDLAEMVLGEDLDRVRGWFNDLDGGQVDAGVVDEVVTQSLLALTSRLAVGRYADKASLLAARRAVIASVVDEHLTHPMGEQRWAELFQLGEAAITSGPVLGMSPVVALLEELRRFGWAVLWLHQLNLARVNFNAANRPSLALVHDGLGDALQRWSRRYVSDHPHLSLYSLFAPQGKTHRWVATSRDAELFAAPNTIKVVVNLNLQGNAVIGAAMRNVVFANCDFRGTLFARCSFENVTLLNCRLDGALLSGCATHGRPSDTEDDRARRQEGWRLVSGEDARSEPPIFALPESSVELARWLADYQEVEDGSCRVLSGPPGTAAVPVPTDQDVPTWAPLRGGLNVQGSRLSALTIRDTTFRDAAPIRFLQVRGSGLDVVELGKCPDDRSTPRFVFEDSLVRHASFTSSGEGGKVFIDARGCVLAQWWIGAAVSGSLTMRDCLVSQVATQGQSDFTATMDPDCIVTGLIGAAPDAETLAFDLPDESSALRRAGNADLARFRDRISRTDYRRT